MSRPCDGTCAVERLWPSGGIDVCVHAHDFDVSALHHVGVVIGEQPVGARGPALADDGVAGHRGDHRHPERAPHGGGDVRVVEFGCEGVVQRVESGLIVTTEIRGDTEPAEIVRTEFGRIDVHPAPQSRRPVAGLELSSGPLEFAGDRHRFATSCFERRTRRGRLNRRSGRRSNAGRSRRQECRHRVRSGRRP
jgi:hypothetical protein